MKKLLIFMLLASLVGAAQTTPNYGFNVPGYNTPNWNYLINSNFFQLDSLIHGIQVNETPIGTYTVATLPASANLNTVASVTDAVGFSCTVGGGSTSMLCRWNGSTWIPLGLSGYVDFSSNQTVGGNKTFTGTTLLNTGTAKNFETTRYADQYAGGDIGAAYASALATCPTLLDASSGVTYPSCNISLEGYAGTTQVLTTPIVIYSPFVHLIGPGSGQLTIQWCGSGPGIDISTRHSGNATVTQAGKFGGFTMQGCGTAGGVGIQYGDIIGGVLDDIVVQGFTGTGSAGFRFNNQTIWTERTLTTRLWAANNTVNYLFENTNSGTPAQSVSFGYSRFLDMRCNTYFGQTCMLFTGTVEFYHSVMNLQCNVTAAGTGPVLSFTNGAIALYNTYSLFFEGGGTAGVTNLAINGSHVATVTSTLNPPVGSAVAFKNMNAGYLINGLEGTVLTTGPTSFTATIPGSASYASTVDAGIVGYESIRVDSTSSFSGFGTADYNGNLLPVYLGTPSTTGSGFHLGYGYNQGQQMLDGGYVSSYAGSGSSALLELPVGVNNLWGFGIAENPTIPIFSPFVTMANVAGNAFTFNTLAGSTAVNGMAQVGKVDYQGNAAFSGRVTTGPAAFSGLASCSSGLEGSIRGVTDSTTATWGATITGGGSNHVLAYCNGTNWTVAAK
jgi:hypothetical protein